MLRIISMRPKIVDDYREICEKIAALEKDKKALKPKIHELIEQSGGWDDCYFQARTTTKYFDENILAWVKSAYPNLDVTSDTLDWDKFERFINLGEINIRDMPPECWQDITTQSIMVNKRRSKKDEN